ncbi:uncharacterized protein LOC113348127 [Papaver somniferum]|uniref:uncharacterized protein LOC113348127 n=1 Tax=Papaver somniferum TaxID=3469 RepID=UPI000E6F6836|nr:uncharacterized protein LOC113348127 [Papaver somniferum]XP_026447619.1 uncharacterized protein LOC113348127 [Papaver somniferum]
MVHVFILGSQLQHKVDDQDWLSVENIEDFNRIPWGEKSYVLCFENTQKAIKYKNDKEDPTTELSLKPRGLPQALVVWILKLFPHLLEKYGSESRTKGQRPLILTVLCEEVINYKKLYEKIKGVVCSDDRLQEIRAVGEAFRDAAWEEAVSENHDLEDASANGPRDEKNQAMNSSDDNRHVDQEVPDQIREVPDQIREVIGAGDAERGSHLGVRVLA